MKSLGACRQRSVLHTTKKQSASTNWKLNLRPWRQQKRVGGKQRQIKATSGTKNPKQTRLRVKLVNPTAAGKVIRRTTLRIRQRREKGKASLRKKAASKERLPDTDNATRLRKGRVGSPLPERHAGIGASQDGGANWGCSDRNYGTHRETTGDSRSARKGETSPRGRTAWPASAGTRG
jgi:hypothetical protein